MSGLTGKEAILTMTMNATDQKTQQSGAMAITNDMWLVPEVPGYEQVREFHERMAKKLATAVSSLGVDFSRMLAQNPGAADALKGMGKEMQKIEGVPVQQIMRMGTTVNGAPLPARQKPLSPRTIPPPCRAQGTSPSRARLPCSQARFRSDSAKRRRSRTTRRPPIRMRRTLMPSSPPAPS